MGIGIKALGGLLSVVLLLLLTGILNATTPRTICGASYHAPVYHAPYVAPYVAPAYVAPTYQQYNNTAILPVKVNDYYFTAADYYRDNLVADAAAHRAAREVIWLQQQFQAPQGFPAAPPGAEPPLALRADRQPHALIASANCAKCHNSTTHKGGFSLFDPQGQLRDLEDKKLAEVIARVSSEDPSLVMPPPPNAMKEGDRLKLIAGFMNGPGPAQAKAGGE